MTLQNLPFSFQPPPLPSDLGPGLLAPPAAARQPLRTALGEAFSTPCQESWFLFKLHKGSCFNQKVCLRNFMSLFHDCGWEKLGARVVFCSWSAAAFPREQTPHFSAGWGCQGRLPATRPPPALLLPPAPHTARGRGCHVLGWVSRGEGAVDSTCRLPWLQMQHIALEWGFAKEVWSRPDLVACHSGDPLALDPGKRHQPEP